MADLKRLGELKKFLRARRAAVNPARVGARPGGRRRTPGLRREEVAALANVSAAWYTWLEQGRDIQMSHAALERIAAALQLDASDRVYLMQLSGVGHVELPESKPDVTSEIQLILDRFVHTPSYAVNARMDVVAYNHLANLVYDFEGYKGPLSQNHVWRLFMDSKRRKIYPDWDGAARFIVGILRARYATHVGDPAFEELIQGLLHASEEFATLWEQHHTAPLTGGSSTSELTSRILGPLKVRATRLVLPDSPQYFLGVLLPLDERTNNAFIKFAKARFLPSARGR